MIEVDPWPSSYNVVFASAGPALQARVLSSPVIGSNGTLRLSLSVVSVSPTSVMLSASDPNISLPASAVIPAGSITHDVPFTIGPGFDSSRVIELRAQLGAETAVAYATQAAPGQSVGFQLFAGGQFDAPPGSTTPDYGPGVLSLNGYATQVQFACQGLPPGAVCIWGRNPVDLSPGGFVNTSLRVQVGSGTQLGIYNFKIVASDGALSVEATATVAVSDFAFSISPSSQTIVRGRTAFYTLTMTPQFGWSQTVSTTCPVTPSGPRCSLDNFAMSSGQISFTVDTQTAPAGDYNFTANGTGSGVTRSATANLRISDFLAVPPQTTSATIPVGGSAHFTFALNSEFGFSDQFTFHCSEPVGITCTFDPNSATLPANGSINTQLTIRVNSRPTAQALPVSSTPQSGPATFWVLTTLLFLLLWKIAHQSSGLRLATVRVCSLLFMLAIISAMASCGGGGDGTATPPPPPVIASSPSLTKTIGTINVTVP